MSNIVSLRLHLLAENKWLLEMPRPSGLPAFISYDGRPLAANSHER